MKILDTIFVLVNPRTLNINQLPSRYLPAAFSTRHNYVGEKNRKEILVPGIVYSLVTALFFNRSSFYT